ncbi:MAG: metallophosphoesterase family protein [Rubripirellula sp.]
MTLPNRRSILQTLSLLPTANLVAKPSLGENLKQREPIRLGLIADLHGGLANDAASRLDCFVESMKQKDCDAVLQMGDFAFPNSAHQSFVERLEETNSELIHVIGNHEFDFGLKRHDIYAAWNIKSSYYRRDVQWIRILVLDGNEVGSPLHRGGYPSFIGEKQFRWLESELHASDKPILILSHQPLAGHGAINNWKTVQNLLAEHQNKIIACINGHSHLDAAWEVNGVHYLHANSASYFWVGGKTRMAYYTAPLYTTLTIDPKKRTFVTEESASQWKNQSPEEIGYFDRPNHAPKAHVSPTISKRSIPLHPHLILG